MLNRFDKSALPAEAFKIGLKPVARDGNWLQPFEGLADYLEQKAALFENSSQVVFGDIGGTDEAQREIYQILTQHLVTRFPTTYQKTDHGLIVSTDGECLQFSLQEDAPLLSLSRMVAEDLVLMRRSPEGWRLAAGSVCFPSAWKLQEKLGHVMAHVHAPVPDFAQGSRHAMMIERIFDHLPIGETVERGNWSIHQVADLHLPEHEPLDSNEGAKLFLRGEVQTLTKLSSGNDILFTIGIFVDPLSQLSSRPAVAANLAAQLSALNDAELAYKGLSNVRISLHEQLIALST